MHITVPRVLGFLMVLALIGYAFFIGPLISTAGTTRPPSSSVTVKKVQPSGVSHGTGSPAAPRTPSQAPHPRAE